MRRSDLSLLHFSWKEEYYQFKTLSFGLTSYVFTKLVAALFRKEGLRILVYLDDWLLANCIRTRFSERPNRVCLINLAVTGICTEQQEMYISWS